MMSMEKILFIDIDGVLTKDSKYVLGESPKIPKQVWERLKLLSSQGFKIVLITARSFYDLARPNGFFAQLKKHGLENKTLVLGDFGMQRVTIMSKPVIRKNKPKLDKKGRIKTTKKSVESIIYADTDTTFHISQKMYAGKRIHDILDKLGTPAEKIKPELLRKSVKLVFKPKDKSPQGIKKFKENLYKAVREVRREYQQNKKTGLPLKIEIIFDDAFFVSPKNVTKHLGVERALQYLGLEKNGLPVKGKQWHAYAFGDKMSDYSMKCRPQIRFVRIRQNYNGFLKRTEKLLREFQYREQRRKTINQLKKMPKKARKQAKTLLMPQKKRHVK